MSDLPAPLTTPDIDVRDLAGFMLNTERLMASELWALSTPEEFKAAVALWCRAWKQVPAGSLPNDDRTLAGFSGAGARWKKIKDMALRGFVECSDGRLYHKTLCADATRAARKKSERREQTRAATEARLKLRNERDGRARGAQRHEQQQNERGEERGDHVMNSQGQGQGQDIDSSLRSESNPAPISARARLDGLEQKLREAAGAENNPSPGWMILAPIIGLIDQGADLEEEILPAIRAKPNPNARSLDYFVPQIQEFRARRKSAAGAPMPTVLTPSGKPDLLEAARRGHELHLARRESA